MTLFSHFVHVVLALVLPPLLVGVIAKTKAFFAGRNGPPLLQAYWDIAKLLRKGSVFSQTTTWVFRAGPVISLSTALVAALILPFGAAPAPLAFMGDFILFAYVLALGRFFTILAALDTGSAFEGMGAAREATFSALAEPALFFGLLVLAKVSGSVSFSGMLGQGLGHAWGFGGASLVLVLASLFVVLLAENSRIPFDDPNTHLELTMIHEVMVLDHSGPAFGMILWGAAIKLFVFAALLVRIAVPVASLDVAVQYGALIVGVLVLAVVVGVVESVMARLRMTHVPNLLVAACLLSAFGIVLLAR